MSQRFQRALRNAVLAFAILMPMHGHPQSQSSCNTEDCAAPSEADGTKVKIGYTQFAPYSWTSSAGIAEGYTVELIRLLLEPLGYIIQFVPHDNPAQLLESLDAGLIDATTPLSVNAQREVFGEFTDTIHTFSFVVFVPKGSPPVLSLSDLDGVRVGVSAGSQGNRLIEAVDGAITVPLASTNEMLLPFLTGEVEAILGPEASLLYNFRRAGLGRRVGESPLELSQSAAGFLTDRSQNKLREDFNRAIWNAQSNGHVKALYDDWFRPEQDPFTYRESLAAFLAGGAILLVLLYWFWLHYGVRKRAQAATNRANLLHEVLNATGATLMIADKEMRPVWWNDAYVKNYPRHLPLLQKGTNLKELIARPLRAYSAAEDQDLEESEAMADQQIAELRAGGETTSVTVTSDGRTLKTRSALLPSGQFGIIATDVTALTTAHEELKANSDRLRDANRQLSEFSHVAAHDLAGPLRNIRNLHKWILEDIGNLDIKLDGETIENFELIDRLIERQSVLIADLLAYSSSDEKNSAREFDPASRLESIIDLSNLPAGFVVTKPMALPTLFADPVGFDIVLRNLISNAAKHHDRRHGVIAIGCEVGSGEANFSVTDDGPGIEVPYLETIFQPFRTLKSRDHGGGTGLGLSFVARTVARWGVRILSGNCACKIERLWFRTSFLGLDYRFREIDLHIRTLLDFAKPRSCEVGPKTSLACVPVRWCDTEAVSMPSSTGPFFDISNHSARSQSL